MKKKFFLILALYQPAQTFCTKPPLNPWALSAAVLIGYIFARSDSQFIKEQNKGFSNHSQNNNSWFQKGNK